MIAREIYYTIDQIKQAGGHFFKPTRFGRCRIASKCVFGGRYFITSDGKRQPRRYTIREIIGDANGNVDINTVGELQEYETVEAAKNAARKLVNS